MQWIALPGSARLRIPMWPIRWWLWWKIFFDAWRISNLGTWRCPRLPRVGIGRFGNIDKTLKVCIVIGRIRVRIVHRKVPGLRCSGFCFNEPYARRRTLNYQSFFKNMFLYYLEAVINVQKEFMMTWFELGPSGVGIDIFVNCISSSGELLQKHNTESTNYDS